MGEGLRIGSFFCQTLKDLQKGKRLKRDLSLQNGAQFLNSSRQVH